MMSSDVQVGILTIPVKTLNAQGSHMLPFYNSLLPSLKLATTNLFFISKMSSSQKISCEWNIILYNLLGFAFFIQPNYLKIHPSCYIYSFFFLLLSSIQWYGCTTVCLTIICCQISELIPVRGLYKQSCCEHLCKGIYVNISLRFSDINAH